MIRPMNAVIEEPTMSSAAGSRDPERVAGDHPRAAPTIVSMVATDEELRYIGHSPRTGADCRPYRPDVTGHGHPGDCRAAPMLSNWAAHHWQRATPEA